MNRYRRIPGDPMVAIAFVLSIFLLSSCTWLHPGREKPEIHLASIKPLPREGLEQRFLIGLNVINPGAGELNISGLSYTLLLNGRNIASGVSGKMESIPAYSESRIQLEASTHLISGLRVITELLQSPGASVDYQILTKIHTAWWPVPIEVSEQGAIRLDGN